MPASSKSARKAVSHAAGAALSQRLNPAMACDTAFRIIARHCLEDLAANQPATCQTDPAALHRMRIALTRLRTAIVFFSPVVSDPEREQIRRELKWLNSHLGGVRDLDVAIERLQSPRAVAEMIGSGAPGARPSSATGAHAQFGKISSPHRQYSDMGREWILVDHPRQAGGTDPRAADRRLQRRQTGALATQTHQEE